MKLCVQHAYCTCSLLIFVNIHEKQYSFSFFLPWVVLLQLAVVLWRGGVEWKPDSVKYQLTSFFPAQFSLSDYLHQPFISNTYTQHKIHTTHPAQRLLMLVPMLSQLHDIYQTNPALKKRICLSILCFNTVNQ